MSDQEKKKANSVNILEYLLSIGEPLKKDGNNFYRHQDHDSLVINPKKNYFTWNSRNVSGNAVTYLMHVHNISFQDAVKQINSDLKDIDITNFKAPEVMYPSEFKYDVKEVDHYENTIKYLVDDRKIDRELVRQCIQADLIKEDSYKNVVFKWKERGQLIGANLQGTRKMPMEKRLHEDRAYFKKVLPTTKEHTFSGFQITRGYPQHLKFFESPIDLLSYFSLNKTKLSNVRLISMDGLKQQTVILMFKKAFTELKGIGKELESISLGVDNDQAGREFINKFKNIKLRKNNGQPLQFDSELPDLPNGTEKWDWNNELKYRIERLSKKKIDKKLEL
ncbi:DUF3991 domain-containing protein [Paraliobacillus ryukyuensis]|uniref:DUF3991 domain-containing protein n=1 Tax=Paraliobacillus ryukyuensis TaxID=200904 RepID=UPI00117EC79E|nr:DUF3991 domain-containing protein [Paraliobacillus ryukyuensis]